MTKRSRIISFGAAGLLVLAGIGGALVFAGTLGQVLALVFISLGCVLATALVFLEVGLSEDREREQEAARRRAKPRSLRPRRPPALDRMRGRPRRLK